MDWHKYSIHLDPQYEEKAGELLASLDIGGWEIEDGLFPTAEELGQMFVDISPELKPDETAPDNEARINFYLRISGEAAAERAGAETDDSYTIHDPLYSSEEEARLIERLRDSWALAAAAGQLPPLVLTSDISREEDWRDQWKQFYKPIRIQDLLILPAWEELPEDCRQEAEEGRIKCLRLEPGTAFGSGSHESTRLCLDALPRWVKGGERVLDIGCGSGILGLAALLIGADRVTGTELDPACRPVVDNNKALNRITEERFQLLEADLLEPDIDLPDQPYDLIFCNILAPVVIAFAAPGAADRFAGHGSIFITSGIYKERRDEVAAAFRQNPAWELLECNILGDWVSFIARRK